MMERMLPALHVFLFPVIQVLLLYTHNNDMVGFGSVMPIGFVCLILSSLALALGFWIKRDFAAGAVTATAWLAFFLLYGRVHGWIIFLIEYDEAFLRLLSLRHLINSYSIAGHVLAVTLFALVLVIAGSLLNRSKERTRQTNRFLNIFCLALLVFPVAHLARADWDSPSQAVTKKGVAPIETARSEGARLPDIYHIVLDGYARADVLRDHYHYDNSDFVEGMGKKGFQVAQKSHANYFWTFLSLNSVLNMNYLDRVFTSVDEDEQSHKVAYDSLKGHAVLRFVKNLGYTYVHFGTTYSGTAENPQADVNLKYRGSLFEDEFVRVFAATTIMKIFDHLIASRLADYHLYTFETLKTIPAREEPTFTFAHILLPHHPYLFDRNGHVRSDRSRGSQFWGVKAAEQWKKKDDYLEQLIFVNDRIRDIVDRILAESDVPPIILIHSDHGPHIREVSRDEYFRSRVSNLTMAYLPGHPDVLPKNVSPVNLYRLVFNAYFGTDYEILANRMYYSEFERPYKYYPIKK